MASVEAVIAGEKTTPTQMPVALSFEELLKSAQNEFNIDQKRTQYGKAYAVLHAQMKNDQNNPVHLRSLFSLLHSSAYETYYGKSPQNDPNDEEWGHRRCARLLELSYCLQLNMLDLGSVGFNLAPHPTLDSLLESLQVEPGQKGLLFDAVKESRVDSNVLVQRAKDQNIREIMATTLTRLSFCYQNIDAIKTQVNAVEFHGRMEELTKKVIGTESTAAKKALVDFAYNRASFNVQLTKPENIGQALVDCYLPVREMVLQEFATDPLNRESLLAQIKFRQCQFTAGLPKPTALAEAEALCEEAFSTRLPLVGKFQSDQENYDQEKLLCSTRTGLIAINLRKTPREPAYLEKAKKHADALQAFLVKAQNRSDFNEYNESYKGLIQRVRDAMLSG